MTTLVIDTSTEKGVMGIFRDSHILFQKELPFGLQGSRTLMPAIDEAFDFLQLSPFQLTSIAVGIGPGSYTGIRVGVVVAKSIAYACQIPLIGVTSLLTFASLKINSYAILFDARIGGVYLMKYHNFLFSEPEVCPLEQLNGKLEGIQYLISPHQDRLYGKIATCFPNFPQEWQQATPSIFPLAEAAQKKYISGESIKDGHLELLYLRKTQAELNKII